MNPILSILKTVPLLQNLNETEHQSILEHITEQFYPANHLLFSKGDPGDSFFIIKSGQVRIFDPSATGTTGAQIAILGPNQFFGELALIESEPRMASAETLTNTEIFTLKHADFLDLLQKSPEIAEKIGSAYKDRNAATKERDNNP